MTPGIRIASSAALALLLLVTPAPGWSQDSLPPALDRREEARLLRQAAALEAVGDYGAAERALQALLDRMPDSPGGLFALERVLRAQGRAVEVLEAADAYLAANPTADQAYFLKLRILAEVDSLDGLAATGEAWMQADPGSRDAYRETARVFDRAFGPQRALEVIRRGRRATRDSTILAVEAGDLLVRLDDVRGAVREWSAALGDEATQLATIHRSVMGLREHRVEVVDALARRLGAEPTTVARRRAGARLAADVGLEDRALELARAVVPELSDRALRGFLADLARRAEESHADRLALWAYQTTRERTGDPDEASPLDERIAVTALSVGDTALALEVRDRMARGLPPGSDERRRALAASVRLQTASAEVAGARRRLETFRGEFPGAPELDGLSADLADELMARGLDDEARAVVAEVDGPRSALERAYLGLDRGEVEAAVKDLTAALEGLDPSVATATIQLLAILGGLEGEARRLAGKVAALDHARRPDEALDTLDSALSGLPDEDLPALLAMGARIADGAGRGARAAALRERLIADFPKAAETPEAMLMQARWQARAGRSPERIRELLERLIVEWPESPVVPAARRELRRLEGRGS